MCRDARERAALVALLRHRKARSKWSDPMREVLENGGAEAALSRRLDAAGTLFSAIADRDGVRNPRGEPADAANVDAANGASHPDPVTDPVESAIQDASRLVHEWESSGFGVHAFFDAAYPPRLRTVPQMPPLIFTRGAMAGDSRAVAVVGTRRPTSRGVDLARAVSRTLARAGVTVVSGLAAGIDTAAHVAAIDAGGRTVAVIGTGVGRAYPAQNAGLQETIAAGGLVLSQFWPDAAPTRASFLMRNALMSGYAAATVVIEATWRSGACAQARIALRQGRGVVLAREILGQEWAREYAHLPGVHVVDDPAELMAAVDLLVGNADAHPAHSAHPQDRTSLISSGG